MERTTAPITPARTTHPVELHVPPPPESRNRLTVAFRILLALPHLVLVGGPLAAFVGWSGGSGDDLHYEWGMGGVLGAAAGVAAVIAWFAILFTGRYPRGLWDLVAYYLRWRTRAVAYTALLRDEYPPFGEGPYPVALELRPPDVPRNRVSVAFRIVLALPHILAVLVLGFAWALASLIAWFSILLTGRFPGGLYGFGVGVMEWSLRLEAYLLLLHDEYPPFSLGRAEPTHGEPG